MNPNADQGRYTRSGRLISQTCDWSRWPSRPITRLRSGSTTLRKPALVNSNCLFQFFCFCKCDIVTFTCCTSTRNVVCFLFYISQLSLWLLYVHNLDNNMCYFDSHNCSATVKGNFRLQNFREPSNSACGYHHE